MSLARNLFLRASRSSWLADQMTRRAFARRAVRRFMPGEDLGSALDAADDLAELGIGSVLTQLGENVTTPEEARAVRDHYLEVVGRIAQRGLPATISVKLTHLGLDLAANHCLEHVRALVAEAAPLGQPVWIDMEDSSYTDRTLDLYRRVRAEYANVGICLQAYLHRTRTDLDDLLRQSATIRLVKGAYREAPAVALRSKRDVDATYVALAASLLERATPGGGRVVFGTHDMRLVARVQRLAERLQAPRDAYEFHLLYGIRTGDQRALAAQGNRVRTLISYGSAWFPWYMRRLAERPANVWFVLRSLL